MRALIFELRPGNLENDGLLAALRTHTAALQGRIGLPVVVDERARRAPAARGRGGPLPDRPGGAPQRRQARRRRARSSSTIDRRGPTASSAVRDDGKGFDAGAVPDGHLGLAGMRARADKIGGAFTVDVAAGRGHDDRGRRPAAVAERAVAGSPRPCRPSTSVRLRIRASAE